MYQLILSLDLYLKAKKHNHSMVNILKYHLYLRIIIMKSNLDNSKFNIIINREEK